MNFLRDPKDIEEKSQAFISAHLEGAWAPEEKQILTRIIHATGDLSYASLTVIHPDLVPEALKALRQGAAIVTDVEMVRSGINASLAAKGKCPVICAIREEEVIRMATARSETRAMVAMEYLAPRMWGSVVAIGNAPTALFRLLELIESGQTRPAVIIGTPVGFVGASEAKEALEKSPVPFLTVRGSKGGSTVAAAAVNALLHLAFKGGFKAEG
ncbi:precorrin-8X methylmutase [Thermanaeromonas toyohensis ToBE]|uniref:Precorrin-8X methylmutase n=1 Tax=Thermanaeromonas toyohensis ToBE TaxID=698762 RepID=A0A1W1VVD8_9FIRM|nr:precorrin-8X methylmutase [Thermanaeromonas toyohensis]SMB97342.1 precorrin-8X methylmutase [Thermanaeromonas toyohensis ToBE]